MFVKLKIVISIVALSELIGCASGGNSGVVDITSKNSELAEDITISIASQRLTTSQEEILREHNIKRNLYFHDSNLTYNINLEKEAQIYANKLANSGKFEHDKDNNHAHNYGENLYADSENKSLTIKEAMLHWFDEEKILYNYSDGSCQEEYYDNGLRIKCGHYTQVIWQDTREVGCASSQYKTGNFKGGYVYVCKYYKAGNTSLNGKKEKPYCTNYDKSDIYIGDIPTNISLAGKSFPIELVVEDRVNCTRSDNGNSAIDFSSNLKSAKVKDFQIFNNEEYPNTLDFNSIKIDGKTIIMRGVNKNIVDEKYKNKPIFMKFTLLGQTADYYSVDLEWNGLDENEPLYSRDMKAKLYK
ncbi:MAG: hypothetical protein KAU90_09575 [Sulfurovaceae bacterium]|nr:hypothetical protein [Sulfurovaceae bacterium]